MFIDYYEILDIPIFATLDDIKAAFKKQALKWHPDKNPEIDTTMKMQEINEAYLILKDLEAREKYDIEYRKFKEFKKQKSTFEDNHSSQKSNDSSERKYYNSDYEFDDQLLKKWMENAVILPNDHDRRVIESIIDDNTFDEDFNLQKGFDKKLESARLTSRLESLEKYSKLNEFLIATYKSKLTQINAPQKQNKKSKISTKRKDNNA